MTAELYRHVSDRAALYAIVHESVVVGDGAFDPDGPAPFTDGTVWINEIQIGGQVHREYYGGLLFARLGWEAQHYKDLSDISESASLMGVAASIGLMR